MKFVRLHKKVFFDNQPQCVQDLRKYKINLDITTVVRFILLSTGKSDWKADNMNNDLTHGSVLKTMIRFSLPFLLSYFLQTLYGMADLFVIGRFESANGTTAVSIGS